MTHQDNHPNEKIATPIPLYAWWFGLLVVGWLVPLVSFWQVIGLLCCQAVWDLSWHAITYHRSFDEGYAQADQEWIRTCTLLAAFLIFFCPHVDTTDVSVILSFIEVPRVWHWWWYGPIVC